MDTKDKVEGVIMAAIDRLNSQLPNDKHVEKTMGAALSESSELDSLGLVVLIAEVENGVEDAFDVELALTEEEDLLSSDGPLATVGTLTSFVDAKVREHLNG